MKFIAVTNDQMTIPQLVTILATIEPYIDQVILREKSKSIEEINMLCQQLKLVSFNMNKIILHGHLTIAIQNGITHVHFPGSEFAVPTLKAQYPSLAIGQSVHSVAEAKLAEAAGVDYILYGHIFQSSCKPGLQPRGILALKTLTAAVHIPVIAIGGIHPTHVKILQHVNIAGFAVMSSIFNVTEPATAARLYKKKIKLKGEKKSEKKHLFKREHI